MHEQHYRVGSKIFINAYAGLYESAKTNIFCEFIIPQYHLDSFTKVDVQSLSQYTSQDLIEEKIRRLRDTYPRIRFHYTGGRDSHTMMLAAQKLGIKFEQLFTHTNTIWEDPKDEYEFVSGIEYAKTTGMHHIVHRATMNDVEEVWCNPDCFNSYDDFYHGFNPIYTDLFLRNYNKDYLELLGLEKPRYFIKGNNYYWLLHDAGDYCTPQPHEDFFIGSFFPELAIKQVMQGLAYIKKFHPTKQGFVDHKDLDVQKFCRYLGLDDGIDTKINKTNEDYWKYGYFNEKHRRCLYQVFNQGKHFIVNEWVKRGWEIADKLRHAPHGLHEFKFIEPKIKQEVCMTTPVVRIGAIFKLNQDSIELLPHKDISLLT